MDRHDLAAMAQRPRRNLRHLRVFLAVAELGSPTLAAERCRVSQPAVTQALAKLEGQLGARLFDRTRAGFVPTERGGLFAARIRRAMARLDAALAEVAPRLAITATLPQLAALAAMSEARNFTLAARALGLAQPTVHRAVRQVEQDAGRALFDRTAQGPMPTRACRALVQATRLALAEMDQADADLAAFDGRDAGRIVVGALPLSRSVVLPEALARFRADRPLQCVTVIDGPYDAMLAGLRRGEIDFMIGALRDPLPVADVVQEPLFTDHLAVVARPGHPLAGQADIPLAVLGAHPWVVPRAGTPSRAQFDTVFAAAGLDLPASILECGSILMMRELLVRSDLLGCISERQAEAEIDRGLLRRLPLRIGQAGRRIGLTCRADWHPTRAQSLLLDHVRAAARAA